MTVTTFTVFVFALTLGGIVAMWRHVRRAPKLRVQGWFLFGVGFLSNLAYSVGLFSGGTRSFENASGTRVIQYSDLVMRFFAFADVALIALSLTVIGAGILTRQKINTSAVPFLFAALIALLSNVGADHGFATVNQWAALLLLVATIFLPSGRDAARGVAYFAALYFFTSGVLLLVQPDAATYECTRKCTSFGFISAGINGNGNAFGLAAALLTPFVWIALTGPARWLITALGATFVVVSGSRSALLALGVFVALALVQKIRWGRVRFGVAVLGTTVIGFIGILLPFVTLAPEALSTRGRVWAVAREYLMLSPLFGRGPNSWKDLAELGAIYVTDTYSVHNVWLDVIYTAGFAGFLLVAVGVLMLMMRTGTRDAYVTYSMALLPILAAGILERTFALTAAGWLALLLPALILASSPGILASNSNIEGKSAKRYVGPGGFGE